VRRLISSLAIIIFAYAPAFAQDKLLSAVGFALTGRDDAYVKVIDRNDCIFQITSEFNNWQNRETYYLNAVDPSRTTIAQVEKTMLYPFPHIEIDLYGEKTIYDQYSINPKYPTKTERKKFQRLTLPSNELERVIRAWKYVFSNGCHGTRSTF
jgi:hypothetical protein